MQVHWHTDAGHDICTVQHAMTLLHVQNLDSENIRRLAEFFDRKEKWRWLMLHRGPPFHHGGNASKFGRPQGPQNTQHIQVGMRLVKIAARRGSIQDERLEILPSRIVQPFHQILQRLMYITHRVLRLPASRSSTAATAASAKSAKSSAARIAIRAPAKSAAAPPAAHSA